MARGCDPCVLSLRTPQEPPQPTPPNAPNRRGDDQRDGGQEEQRQIRDGRRGVELLLRVLDAPKEEAAAHDEEEVREDGAQQGGLHDADLVVHERLHADHHLHRVPERRVEEAAHLCM